MILRGRFEQWMPERRFQPREGLTPRLFSIEKSECESSGSIARSILRSDQM